MTVKLSPNEIETDSSEVQKIETESKTKQQNLKPRGTSKEKKNCSGKVK